MPEGYTLYDKAHGAGSGPGRPGSAAVKSAGGKKGRPQSAGPGRGKGANNIHAAIAKQDTKNSGRAAAMKAYYGDNGGDEGFQTKEALQLEINELKKKNKLLEKQAVLIKGENARLEGEVKAQQGRLDRLMDPAVAARSGISASGTRKEVEKSLLVRHMKQQMMQLRATIAEKDSELESAMRSAKMSNITELITEREEYYYECKRLRTLVKQLRGDLTAAKRSKKGSNEEVELELRREVARLAAGYQDILGTIRTRQGGGSADQAAAGAGAGAGAAGAAAAGSGARHAFAGSEQQQEEEEGPPAKHSNRPQLDIIGGNSGGGDSSPSKQHKKQSVSAAAAASAAASDSATNSSSSLPFKIGDKVEGQFQGHGSWYPGTVKYITGPGTVHVLYEDGDEEPNAKVENVRLLGGATNTNTSTKEAAVAAPLLSPLGGGGLDGGPSADGADIDGNFEEGVPSPAEEKEEEEAAAAAAAATGLYRVGQAVEALYYNGSTWYPAKVNAAHLVAGHWHYDLHYDDGDREMKVHESKVKPKEGAAAAPSPAPAPAPAAKSKPKGSGLGLDALLGLSPSKDPAESLHSQKKKQQEQEQEQPPRDYDQPSRLALDLRAATKNILRSYSEFQRAFRSMAGLSSPSSSSSPVLSNDSTTELPGFRAFAEDVLQRVLSASNIASLYDEAARGAPALSFGAFVLFVEGCSADDLRSTEKQEQEQAALLRAKEEEEVRRRLHEQEEQAASNARKEQEEEERLKEEAAVAMQRKLAEEESRAAALRARVEEQERQAAAEEEAARMLERERIVTAKKKKEEEEEVEVVSEDGAGAGGDDFLSGLLAEPSEMSVDEEEEEATPRYADDFEG